MYRYLLLVVSRFNLKTFLLVLCIAVISTTSAPLQVFATDRGFYSANDILFYDPDSCSVGGGEGTNVLVGNDNIEKVLRYFVGKGLTLAQASGITGNFFAESGMNPAIIQGGEIADENYTPVNGVGFGIAQWTFDSRQKPLVELSKSSNRKITDLSLQLDYTWQELNGNRAGALTNLKAETTADKAAFVFHRDFEGSADSEEQIIKNRGGGALSIYSQFKSIIPDGTTTASNSAACTGSGQASEYIDGFAIYNQNDPRWDKLPYGNSTIGDAGCGPTALAMIITALTKKEVLPTETATYAADSGYSYPTGGSYHSIIQIVKNWGLTNKPLDKSVADINKALRDGALIEMSGTGSAPFTGSGHFIVIRAVTADGKWLIGDSNGKVGGENSKKEWDPGYILSMVGTNIWAVYK